MLYGYANILPGCKDVVAECTALRAAGCVDVRIEKRRQAGVGRLKVLADLLTTLRAGDTLVVTRVESICSKALGLSNIISNLIMRGAHLRVTEQPVFDTDSANGHVVLEVLAILRKMELNVHSGRPPVIDAVEVRRLHCVEGLGQTAIASRLGVGRASIYRILNTERKRPD